MELLQQIKDFLIPELEAIRQEQSAVRERLNAIDLHLVDQSRRIDETNQRIDRVHDDLVGRIDKVHADLLARIDATNQRIDATNQRIDESNKRIDETNQRVDKIHADLLARIDRVHGDLILRFDENHRRMDRLYEVSVRREEHASMERRVANLEQAVEELQRRLAA